MPLSLNSRISWNTSAIIDPRLEAIVGINNFQDPWFLRKGITRSRSVGLIGSLGTGWLIGPSLLMTNWHVLRRKEWAQGKFVQFNFEQNEDGTMPPPNRVALNPNKVFISVEELDYAVVSVDGSPGDELGYIDISRSGTPTIDNRVNIIQHPGAGLKKIAIRDNGLKFADGNILQYWTDTEHGSSGSPVFDDRWEIVGLHFRHDFATAPDMSKVVYNEAHDINAVRTDLLSKLPNVLG